MQDCQLPYKASGVSCTQIMHNPCPHNNNKSHPIIILVIMLLTNYSVKQTCSSLALADMEIQ